MIPGFDKPKSLNDIFSLSKKVFSYFSIIFSRFILFPLLFFAVNSRYFINICVCVLFCKCSPPFRGLLRSKNVMLNMPCWKLKNLEDLCFAEVVKINIFCILYWISWHVREVALGEKCSVKYAFLKIEKNWNPPLVLLLYWKKYWRLLYIISVHVWWPKQEILHDRYVIIPGFV